LSVTSHINFPSLPELKNNPIYIKELSFRSQNLDQCAKVLKEIKDLQKAHRLKLSIEHKQLDVIRDEPLHDRIADLHQVQIRPTLEGRRSDGTLTAFKNGFKFVNKNQKSLTFMNSNIKYAVFQPCNDEQIVLLHFYLAKPIII
jgi:nucleosome binding factor SPN SPT16 subunit